MPVISHGRREIVSLPAGTELRVIAFHRSAMGRVGRMADRVGAATPDLPSSWSAVRQDTSFTAGPFKRITRFMIEAERCDLETFFHDGIEPEYVP